MDSREPTERECLATRPDGADDHYYMIRWPGQAPPPPTALPPESPGYRVPRRFGMGTIVVGMTLFSVFIAILVAIGLDPFAISYTAGFFVAVALAQMLLYGGNRPRRASAIGGALAAGAMRSAYLIILAFNYPPYLFQRMYGGVTSAVVPAFIGGAIIGAFFGYLAGGILAGIFLVLDYIESWLTGKPRHIPGETSTAVESSESA